MSLVTSRTMLIFYSILIFAVQSLRSVELKQVVLKENELKGIKAPDKDLTRGEYWDPTPKGII